MNSSQSTTELEESDDASIPEIDPRVQMAAERTILAWIRTGLALMAFGFVIARFAFVLQSLGVNTNTILTITANLIGVILMILGVITTAAAPRHYQQYFDRIEASKNQFTATSLTHFVAYGATVVGVLLTIYLLIVDYSSLGQVLQQQVDSK